MKCNECGEEFEQVRSGTKLYCSSKCRNRAKGRRGRKSRFDRNHKPRNCKYCGKEFMPNTNRQVFCNPKCTRMGSAKRANKIQRENFLVKVRSLGLDFCWKCGYDESFCAIDIHHIDPSTKTKSANKSLAELRTCASLCARCHRVYHCEDSKEMSFIEWIEQ